MNIEIVNNYISDMSKAKGSKVFSSDACPKSYRCYRKDEIHFNHKGKQLYAQEMLKVLNFPRLSFQLKRQMPLPLNYVTQVVMKILILGKLQNRFQMVPFGNYMQLRNHPAMAIAFCTPYYMV